MKICLPTALKLRKCIYIVLKFMPLNSVSFDLKYICDTWSMCSGKVLKYLQSGLNIRRLNINI